ncbi:hypothetical protein BWZ22_06845 [Seonamhaeicola sp. S2-3]|nr:hypothetical protein BWZ22_06845 [Seonamhaeicola sp. S2-3]
MKAFKYFINFVIKIPTKISLKSLILIIINGLVFLVVITLSITFYNQFSKELKDRILLQLNSIKTLKQNQVEKLIQSEWNNFINSSNNSNDSLSIKVPNNLQSGIYDFTKYNENNQLTIALVDKNNNKVKYIPYKKITSILLERTGMGDTGESYLVGEDYRMRSQSRFLKDSLPYNIVVKTNGVKNALTGNNGKGLYKDYRGIDVYGVYGPINIPNLNLVILSEIDKDEVEAPIKDLQKRLFLLMFLIIFIAVLLSLFLTKIIANPILNMKHSLKEMVDGNYSRINNYSKNSNEIKEMFIALDDLKKSLQGAVTFSKEIGEMNLSSNYTPKSNNDSLGKSLIKMRDKLIEFRNNENKHRLNTKRQLVDGLENERRRLARELHDGLGPLLTSLKFYIDNNIKSEDQRSEMKTIIDNTISEIRLMSNALMPTSIDDFGVGTAILNFIESIKSTTNINISFEDITRGAESNITKNQQINIFRITQELINNTLKHAKAKNIKITLSEFEDFISLFYFDDGQGFNIKTVALGSGITNIKERVEICKGEIKIHSKPNNTTFEIELPIDNEDY